MTGQIEKGVSLEPNKFNNGYAMTAKKRLFFAAGSRSHDKLM
jgi:hypothetical protein